ncbi:MAG: diacylglycerol kinase [Desulfocapsa sp.]|nr:diacylglycerol kinase [Desulfocapsa sp.]
MEKPTSNIFQRRILKTLSFSSQGLRATFREEEAFRVEVLLAVFLIPLGLFLGDTAVDRVLLVGSVVLVLIVEILNSAIETVVDRFGGEQHELSGRAKDQGSAAVLLSLLMVVLVWTLLLVF